MAEPIERVGLRGVVSKRQDRLGGIMSQISAGRKGGQTAKKKAGKWLGKKRSAYSD